MLDAAIARLLRPGMRVAVACSGGRDSVALLHVAHGVASRVGAGVHALHVHHGLSVHAADWLAHCQQQCEAWSVPGARLGFHSRSLVLRPLPGESVEAVARQARYRALAQMACEAGCDTVLLAHHRDDQVETFLLQALRGAGPAGLSAMPAGVWREGIQWVRPWLEIPREAIQRHVDAHALPFVEDDSNGDRRYARNRLRLAVLPALRQAFPDADTSIAAAARHAQDAQACLDALAGMDRAGVAQGEGDGEWLDVPKLLALGPPRARNLLRHWLLDLSGQLPAATLLQRLSLELHHVSDGRWPHAQGQVSVYRRRLTWHVVPPSRDCASRRRADRGAGPPVHLEVAIGAIDVPSWSGTLEVEPVEQGGVALAELIGVNLRERQGGEQFQSHPGGIPRALKKQFQAAGVPSWAREGPLVHAGDRLIYVPGLGLDARCLAPGGVPQVSLRWQPHETLDRPVSTPASGPASPDR